LLWGELAGALRIGVFLLDASHDELEVNVEAQFEEGFIGVDAGSGQGLVRWSRGEHRSLVRLGGWR